MTGSKQCHSLSWTLPSRGIRRSLCDNAATSNISITGVKLLAFVLWEIEPVLDGQHIYHPIPLYLPAMQHWICVVFQNLSFVRDQKSGFITATAGSGEFLAVIPSFHSRTTGHPRSARRALLRLFAISHAIATAHDINPFYCQWSYGCQRRYCCTNTVIREV